MIEFPTIKTIIVTGHSLGGAFATLYAGELMWMISYTPYSDDRISVVVYTFGAPMVGNMAYVRWWNNL